MSDDVVLLDPLSVSAAAIETMIERVRSGATTAKTVIVPPLFAKRCAEALPGVRVSSVVAYPLGLAKPTVKAIEATSLAKDGVEAIEVTPYPSHVIDGDWDALRAELLEIVRGARAARAAIRVIVRVDGRWVGQGREMLAATVARSACDGLIIDDEGKRTTVSI